MMRLLLAMILSTIILSCQDTDGNRDAANKKQTLLENKQAIAQTIAVNQETTPKVDPQISTEYLMGKFDPAKHSSFTKIATQFASNNSMILRKEAYNAFKEMHAAAKKEGISLKIISATRPFPHQKRIWEAKWNGARKVDGKALPKSHPDPMSRALKILEYSSMPGTSRHHWGTDIDINALTNAYFEKGKGLKEYNWLVANAPGFGFCQPYSPKGTARPDGYNEEKWHWSYLPISKNLTEQYKLRIKNEDISGFAGAESAPLINVVKKYVLGINQDCL